jgi:hypothetical protein
MPKTPTIERPLLRPIPVTKLLPTGLDTPVLPTQPTLRAIADDVIAELKYVTAVNATHPGAARGRLDQALQKFLAARTPKTREAVAAHSRLLLEGTDAQRASTFGRYARVPVADYLAVGSDTFDTHLRRAIPANELNADLDALRTHLVKLPPIVLSHPKPDQDLEDGLAFTKMRFFIKAVRCVEETDEWGSDEINIGAVVTDPTGKTWIDPEFQVSDDFDTGELVTYDGLGHKLTGWNLVTGDPWPHCYAVTLCMAEKDDGGFAEFLKELWDFIGDKVKAAIGAAIGGAIGGALGGVIGAAVGAIAGAVIGWLVGLLGDNADEILGANVLTMTLASARKSYYDWAEVTTAAGMTARTNFYGDGGHYRVLYAWKVFTA